MASEAEQNVRQYLEGADYPASKNELAGTARNNGAPQEFVERLVGMEDTEFSEPGEVVEALQRLEKPEEAEAGEIGNP